MKIPHRWGAKWTDIDPNLLFKQIADGQNRGRQASMAPKERPGTPFLIYKSKETGLRV